MGSAPVPFNQSFANYQHFMMGVRFFADYGDFDERMRQAEQRIRDMEAALGNLADTSRKRYKQASDAADSWFRTQHQALRQIRWQIITVMFFITRAGRMISSTYKNMEEASNQLANTIGARALARTYEADLGGVAAALRETVEYHMSAPQSLRLAQHAMLKDHGQFVNRYAELWEAARVAAVTGGGDAEEIFTALIESMAGADAKAADAATTVFHLAYAVEEYALSTGRAVDELNSAEVQQVLFNKTMERTNELLEAGADRALAEQDRWKETGARWEEFKLILGILTGDDTGVGVLNRLLEVGAQAAVVYGTEIAAYFSAMLGGAVDLVEAIGNVFYGDRNVPISHRVGQVGLELFKPRTRDIEERIEESRKRITEALGFFRDPAAGGFGPEIPGLDDLSDRNLDPIIDHILKREDLIEDHNHRMEQLEQKYLDRQEDIWDRYYTNIERIGRQAQRSRESALRAYTNRVEDTTENHLLKLAQMEQKYFQDQTQAKRKYDLDRLHDEALYQYERGLLVAEGDVLAIEDLDARQSLERDKESDGFKEDTRIRKENYLLQAEEQREQFDLRLRQLEKDYDRQIEEIRIKEQDQRLEAAEQRKASLEDAKRDYEQQQDEQEYQHEQSLEAWSQYWTKVAEQAEIGTSEVIAILRRFYGEGGELDVIMSDYTTRQREREEAMRKVRASLITPPRSDAQWGVPWYPEGSPWAGYQHGGTGIASRESYIKVGEGGRPERYSVSPLTSIGQSMTLRWAGGPIQVQGSGMEGFDSSGLGNSIAQGLVLEMSRQIITMRGP